MHRRIGALAVTTCVAACAIPARDNRVDPANSPDVVVRMADFTPAGGVCPDDPEPDFDPLGTFSFVEASARSHCLAIDAHESTEAGGDVIGESGDWTFSLLATDGSVVWSRELEEPFATLSAQERYELPTNRALRFLVTVQDRNGYSASVELPFVALNSPPIARSGPRVSLPLGGAPWQDGSPIDVLLDGSESTDPDGDPLMLEWTLPDGTVLETPIEVPASAPVPVATPGRFLARLRASDGAAWSAPTSAVVNVEPPDIFVSSSAFVSRPLQRLDGTAGSIPFDLDPGFSSAAAITAAQAGDRALVLYSATDGVETHTFLSAGDPAAGAMPTGLDVSDYGLQEPGVLAASEDGLAGTFVDTVASTVRRFDLAGAVPLELGETPLAPLSPFGPFAMLVDETGTTWIGGPSAGYNAGVLVTVSATGTLAVRSTNDRIGFESISVRPESNELWVATLPNDGASTTPFAPGLLRYDVANRQAATVSVGVGSSGATGFLWIDRERAWLMRPGDGARLVDAAALVQGAALESVTIAHVLDSQTLRDPKLDRRTGDLRARSISADSGEFELYIVSTEGEVTVRPAPLNSVPEAIDTGGLFLATASGLLWRSKGTGGSGLVQDLHFVSSSASGGYDARNGGMWLPSDDPTCLLHLAADGSITEAVTSIEQDGTLVAFPVLASFEVSPDGTRAFGYAGTFGEGGLRRFDLAATPPVMDLVDPGEFEWSMLRPSAPLPASTPFVWARSNADQSIVSFPDDANDPSPAPFFVPAAQQTVDDMDLAAGSNDLCAVTVSIAAFPDVSVEFLRITPDGTVTTLDTIVTADYLRAGSAGGWGGTDDVCWFFIALSDDPTGHTRLLSYLPDGTVHNDENLFGAGVAVDMLAVSDRRVFVLSRQITPFEVDRTAALVVAPGVPGSMAGDLYYPHLNTGGIGYASYVRF